MNYDSILVAEPSLQQARYLKRDQGVAIFMRLEMEMDNPDVAAIEKSVSFFVSRHESVRTVFPLIEGEVKQVVLPADERFAIEFVDVNASHKSYEKIRDEYFESAEIRFVNKQKDPLIKFLLFRLEGQKHMLLMLIDHIICDGWSMEKIIRNELMTFYQCYVNGSEPDIGPLKLQLKDYSNQQRAWLSKKRDELSGFWKAKVSGYNDIFNVGDFYNGYFLRHNRRLSFERTVKKVETQKELFAIYDCPRALLYTNKITGQTFNNIKELAKISNCTISSIVYASLHVLLHCYTGKNKTLMMAIIADRFSSENQLIIGNLLGEAYFPGEVSDQLIISDIIEQTFYDILTNCQNMIIDHDYLHLDRAKLRAASDMVVNYIKHNENSPDITRLDEKHIDTETNHYALKHTACEYDDGFILYWKYNKLLFDKELMGDMVECHKNILDFMVNNENRTIGDMKNYFRTLAAV